jgi:hypothetical protein
MTKSPALKTLLPKLELAFGMDASNIYERQRSLIRAGLIEAGTRGRGNGAPASPKNLALLLLALMAAENPASAAERVKDLIELCPARVPINKKGICCFTGRKNLVDAIAHVIGGGEEVPVLTINFQNFVTGKYSAKFSERGSWHLGDGGKSQLFLAKNLTEVKLPLSRIIRSASFDLLELASLFPRKDNA